jgi:hypothetical protein
LRSAVFEAARSRYREWDSVSSKIDIGAVAFGRPTSMHPSHLTACCTSRVAHPNRRQFSDSLRSLGVTPPRGMPSGLSTPDVDPWIGTSFGSVRNGAARAETGLIRRPSESRTDPLTGWFHTSGPAIRTSNERVQTAVTGRGPDHGDRDHADRSRLSRTAENLAAPRIGEI